MNGQHNVGTPTHGEHGWLLDIEKKTNHLMGYKWDRMG